MHRGTWYVEEARFGVNATGTPLDSGDGGALPIYDALIDEHAERIWRMAFRLTGDHDDANDLVQETYYEAWKSIGSLREPKAARAWLIRILVHRAAHRLRRRRTRPSGQRLAEEPSDEGLAGLPDLELLARREDIQRALDGIDPERRTAFLLVFLEGFTCREVGEMLDIPLGTVLSRIHRARSELRRQLEHLAPDRAEGGKDAHRAEGGEA